METIEIVENILKNRTPYEKVAYLLKCYKDLKQGEELNNNNRSVLSFMDKAINMLEGDKDIDIIKCLYVEGLTYEQTAEELGMDRKTVYRQRKRLIKRLSIIIYGDKAL